jgi:uncharacterized repeat protein (TIGR01451 family)
VGEEPAAYAEVVAIDGEALSSGRHDGLLLEALVRLRSTRHDPWLWSLGVLSLLGFAGHAQAVGTPAGTSIVNTATVTYTDQFGASQTVSSNASAVQVDEVLNVTIATLDAGNVAVNSPDADRPLAFTLTNTGNGSEAFQLTANVGLAGDQFDPVFDRIVLDSNSNGVFDSGVDTIYVSGVNDPVLNPDQSLVLFLVSDIPGGMANGEIGLASLAAVAATGGGAPGAGFPGAGTGGGDAVVGATGATGSDQNGYIAPQALAAFTKTQSVSDPFGFSNPVTGAIVTYTLTFSLAGTTGVDNAVITDPIPANTTYVAGSLTLNGSPLTDSADADAGRYTGTAIEVSLGTLAAPSTQTVTLQVLIN